MRMRLFLAVPGEHDCVVLGDVAVSARELVDVAAEVAVVGPGREGLAREDVLADGFVAPDVLYTSRVAVFSDVIIYIFHENIRREDTVHEDSCRLGYRIPNIYR